MKLVLIAIFSVILLVICEPQQEALAEEPSELYYNIEYGLNYDNSFDESRYDEVDMGRSSDRSRDNKSREQDGNYNREEYENRNNKNYNEKQMSDTQNKYNNRLDDSSRENTWNKKNNDKNERKEEQDKNRNRGNDNIDNNRYDNGRSDKSGDEQYKYRNNKNEENNQNKANFNQQIYYGKQEIVGSQRSDRARDNKSQEQYGREYDREYRKNNNDKNEEKQIINTQTTNKYRVDDENSRENYKDKNDKNEIKDRRDKNRNRSSDDIDSNKDDKAGSDKNRDLRRDSKNGEKQDKSRKKENEEGNNENRVKINNKKIEYQKQETGRDKNNDNDYYEEQNQRRDYKNDQRSFDNQNKNRGNQNKDDNGNYESSYKIIENKSKEKNNRNKNDANDRDGSKFEYNNNKGLKNNNKNDSNEKNDNQEFKKAKYDSNIDVGSNKNLNRVTEGYKSDYQYEDGSRTINMDAEKYNKKKEKQSSRSRSESYSFDKKEPSYNNRSPGYGYSYLESLITAPKLNTDTPNEKLSDKYKDKSGNKQDNKKKDDVIEIHGFISKGNEQNDKQVEVDVFVKKADSASETGLDSKGGIYIHKVLNTDANEKGYQLEKPQSELQYQYIKPGNTQENSDRDYKELFNKHVQDKKDLLGGIELLDLISNIGQEIKEQVIEKIPGYHIIQKLDPRKQKSENKQKLNYEQDIYTPKIDLDVYYPPNKQQEEKGKYDEETKFDTELEKQNKEIDVTRRDKSKKERVNGKYIDQNKKVQVVTEINTNKKVDLNDKTTASTSKGNYNQKKNIDIKKEIDVDIRLTQRKENQEVKVNKEGKKEIYDYSISHKQTDLDDKNAQKYLSNSQNDKEKNNRVYVPESYYNSRNSYITNDNSYINRGIFKDRQNERYEDQNSSYEQFNNNLGNTYNGDDYYPSSGYMRQDKGYNNGYNYQGPGNSQQSQRLNNLNDHMKNKQNEEKYIYDFTIGNPEKQARVYNKQLNLIPPYPDISRLEQFSKERDYTNNDEYGRKNFYKHNKNNYESKPNEGWSYQGFSLVSEDKDKQEKNRNLPQYVNDKDNQGGNPYGYKNYQDFRYNIPYTNRGYSNYFYPYNQGFGGPFGLPNPYSLPNLINPLSQQILASSGSLQEYLPNGRDYNLNNRQPKATESYPDYNGADFDYQGRKPAYDTAYQSSNKEYLYEYQLPYASTIISAILFVNCDPQGGQVNDEQLITNPYSNRIDNRYRNDRRRDWTERNREKDNEQRDRGYRNQGRERTQGQQGSDSVDGRRPDRYGAYGQGNYGYPYIEPEIYSIRDSRKEAKIEDRRYKEYRNGEYSQYYSKGSANKNDPNYDFYETFPYSDYAGRRGFGFQKRTYLVTGYTDPITKELLENTGKRRDFVYDKNLHRVSDYYDLYEPKQQPRYENKEEYYSRRDYDRQDLYKTPYPEVNLGYEKGYNNGYNNPIVKDLYDNIGKYNYNGGYYPHFY